MHIQKIQTSNIDMVVEENPKNLVERQVFNAKKTTTVKIHFELNKQSILPKYNSLIWMNFGFEWFPSGNNFNKIMTFNSFEENHGH